MSNSNSNTERRRSPSPSHSASASVTALTDTSSDQLDNQGYFDETDALLSDINENAANYRSITVVDDEVHHLHPRVAKRQSGFSRHASVSSSFLDDPYSLVTETMLMEGDLLGLEGEPGIDDHEVLPDPKNQKMLNLLQENFDFAQRSRVRDKKITQRVNLIFLNILVCVSIGLLLMELEFDARTEHFVGDTPKKCTLEDGTSKCLFDTSITTAIKVLLSVLTIINEFQFLELLRTRVHNQIEHLRDMQILREKAKWKNRKVTPSMLRRLKLLHSPLFQSVYERYRTNFFYFRMMIFFPHPFPFIGTFMDKYLIMWMFSRLAWGCVVFRQYDSTYRMRQAAFREMFFKRHKPSPKFSVPTIMRIYFHNNPIPAVLMFMLVGIVYFGYGIYIFERETDSEVFTFGGSLFLSLECMLTGYPADAYEVFMPVTWTGKYLCILSLTWGLFLFALLVDYVHQLMQLDKDEIDAAHWVQAYKLWHEIRNVSAGLIQIEWKRYKFECKYEDADDDDPEYQQGIAYLEKLEDKQIRRLRELKRMRARIPIFDHQQPQYITASSSARNIPRSPSGPHMNGGAFSSPSVKRQSDVINNEPSVVAGDLTVDGIAKLVRDSVAVELQQQTQNQQRIYTENEVREIVQEAVFMAQHQCIENMSVILDRHTARITEAVEDTIQPLTTSSAGQNTSTVTPPRLSLPRNLV